MAKTETLRASDVVLHQEFREIVVRQLSRTQIVQYAGASGDFNPAHTDDIYAQQVLGVPGVFAHGLLTMGLTGKMLTNLLGADALRSFSLRLTAQVWPGDTLETVAIVKEIVREVGKTVASFDVTTINQNGVVVGKGSVKATLR